MKLSFVIPAYNEEHYIAKCLDSIFKHINDDPDLEVIVVNNGSTDKTKEIAASYRGVTVVDEPRRGTSSARQAGLLAAHSDLVANLDADTVLGSSWIQTVLEEFSKNPKLVCLSGPFIYYDLSRIAMVLARVFYFVSYLAYLVNRFIARSGSVVQGGNFVVKKSAILEAGGYNTELAFYGDDTDIARRMSKVGEVKFTFRLPLNASGRRLAKEGFFTMAIRYGGNYLSMMIFERPLTKTSMEIRLDGGADKLKYEPERKLREWTIASITLIILFAIIAGLGFGAYRLIQLGIVVARLLFL